MSNIHKTKHTFEDEGILPVPRDVATAIVSEINDGSDKSRLSNIVGILIKAGYNLMVSTGGVKLQDFNGVGCKLQFNTDIAQDHLFDAILYILTRVVSTTPEFAVNSLVARAKIAVLYSDLIGDGNLPKLDGTTSTWKKIQHAVKGVADSNIKCDSDEGFSKEWLRFVKIAASLHSYGIGLKYTEADDTNWTTLNVVVRGKIIPKISVQVIFSNPGITLDQKRLLQNKDFDCALLEAVHRIMRTLEDNHLLLGIL